ncbi:hypothetical protein [Gemella morbillorum]|uniref:hypothetical protein n=1 Tax=Gemella morbillorum TaxID=29391 RepID=UPI0023F2104F|nr:hypothetical protein [Gemella morbillorum]
MNTAIFFVLIALISFVLDKMKDGNQKKQNTQKTRKLKKNPKVSEKSSQEIKRSNEFKNRPKKNARVIVDREKEIYSNSKIIDKEKIVNDIIFSEILSKPKSKR